MKNLTEQEIKRLKETKNEQEWNEACDTIKGDRDGDYPNDWSAVVLMSGLMDELNWS